MTRPGLPFVSRAPLQKCATAPSSDSPASTLDSLMRASWPTWAGKWGERGGACQEGVERAPLLRSECLGAPATWGRAPLLFRPPTPGGVRPREPDLRVRAMPRPLSGHNRARLAHQALVSARTAQSTQRHATNAVPRPTPRLGKERKRKRTRFSGASPLARPFPVGEPSRDEVPDAGVGLAGVSGERIAASVRAQARARG